MLKSESITLFRNLNTLGGLKGVKFSYAVAKNLNILKPELESLEKSMEASDSFKEYDAKRVVLVEKHANKDKDGKPKKEEVNGVEQYVVEENKKAFEKDWESLKKEYKDALDARQKQTDEYTELLTTKSEVVLHKIKLEDVPADINAQQMAGIVDLVDEK